MYDVFISCKSEDYGKATPIYHWLKSLGYNPFFAPECLGLSQMPNEMGVFGEEIDAALEEVDNMIVFTSNAQYVKYGYVKDEWRTFVEEQRAGRKTGKLVTILDGVEVKDLPIRLRTVQSFTLMNYVSGLQRYLGEVRGTDSDSSQPVDVFGVERERRERETRGEFEVNGVKFKEVNGVKFKMVKVEGGRFVMGATAEQGDDADGDEKLAHEVELDDYYIGETVVTQELWKAVMGNNPSHFTGDGNLPVECVSWDDAQMFIQKLNGMTGKKFGLPTEAQWEYAARGGRKSEGYKYSGSNKINEVAWYDKNSGGKTHPVKEKGKIANELGLYGMSGNVWEWCEDWYGREYYSKSLVSNPKGPDEGINHVVRGGSWNSLAEYCRVSYRDCGMPGKGYNYCGFRLVLCP